MALTTFETACNVAFVRAIFPVVISIGSERLPAVGTCEEIISLTINLVQMGVPPAGAADIGTELHRLATRCLSQRLATVVATVRLRSFLYIHCRFGAGQIASAAESGHLVFRQAQRGSDGSIPVSVLS